MHRIRDIELNRSASWKDYADGNTTKTMILAFEFIRRFLLHVLPPGFVKIRRVGFLSSRKRKACLEICRALLGVAKPDPAPPETWQALLLRITGVDVTRCPLCQGSIHLKTILTEFAWIASKMKGTYLWSKYQSLVGRKGKKKALVAVGHKILISAYHILKYRVPYKELGANYLDERKKERIARSYIRRLTNLGYAVTLKEVA